MLLTVTEKDTNEQAVVVFDGWMLASLPGLNPLEHPVYDLWAIGCRMKPAAGAQDGDPMAKNDGKNDFANYHRLLDVYWPEASEKKRKTIEAEIWERFGVEMAVFVLDMSGFSA